jgi:5-methyltetrahydrofolate--homocysteine methyltransferase
MTDKKTILKKISEALNAGEREDAVAAVQKALNQGLGVAEILETIREGMDEVGEKYRKGEYFLPELVLGGRAAEGAIAVLLPRIGSGGTSFLGTIVLGTVEGDIHDLGKTIVFAMLSGAGFKVYDVGIDAPASKFVQKVIEVNADIVAASALLSTTVPRLKDIEDALVKAGIRKKVKTMVGGAAVTEQYAKSIGADGYGKDGYDAVVLAKKFMGQKKK